MKGESDESENQYSEQLHEIHNYMPFLSERLKLPKIEKLLTNSYDKNEYVIHIRNLKQTLNHGFILNKLHRVIEFNQKDWLKPYIDMNSELRQEAKNNFEKDLFKLMNSAVFRKTMENMTKYRDIKLVTIERRRTYLVSELNYHTTILFTENLLATEMKKVQIIMNKPVYLGFHSSILDLSKTVMYEFWYDYVKPKYGEIDSFIVHVKIDDICKDIAKDVETRFDTSFEIDRPLPKGKNKKVIGLMKDELGGQIMKQFILIKGKTIYLFKRKQWWR